MAKSKNNNPYKTLLNKLNQIDVSELIESLREVNIDDLKKIDINQVINKVKKSSKIKPAIGIFSAGVLFSFLLLPSAQRLISKLNKARQYQNESNNLELIKTELKNKKEKVDKLSLRMDVLNDSILNKDKLIFISKLINQTSRKANVEIISYKPIDAAKSAKLCKLSNQTKTRSKGRSRRKKQPKKGPFESNLYEINLRSDYLNMIEFIKIIQYYDVTIIPHCLEVTAASPMKRSGGDSNRSKMAAKNPTIITPLSQSGVPIISSSRNNKLNSATAYGEVESRLILKIPSHSR